MISSMFLFPHQGQHPKPLNVLYVLLLLFVCLVYVSWYCVLVYVCCCPLKTKSPRSQNVKPQSPKKA